MSITYTNPKIVRVGNGTMTHIAVSQVVDGEPATPNHLLRPACSINRNGRLIGQWLGNNNAVTCKNCNKWINANIGAIDLGGHDWRTPTTPTPDPDLANIPWSGIKIGDIVVRQNDGLAFVVARPTKYNTMGFDGKKMSMSSVMRGYDATRNARTGNGKIAMLTKERWSKVTIVARLGSDYDPDYMVSQWDDFGVRANKEYKRINRYNDTVKALAHSFGMQGGNKSIFTQALDAAAKELIWRALLNSTPNVGVLVPEFCRGATQDVGYMLKGKSNQLIADAMAYLQTYADDKGAPLQYVLEGMSQP